jgi:MFS transporter, NNP family, nitrate/nitrite transporter
MESLAIIYNRKLMKFPVLLLFWSLWYLNFSARSIISPIMPLIEDEFAISHAMAGALFLSFWVGNTIAVFYSGFLSQKIGYKRTILIGFAGIVITFLLLRYTETYQLFAVTVFFLGIGAGLYLPCAIPLITATIEKKHWGKAISFHETAAGLCLLTIPLIVVWALSLAHWKSIFLIFSAACLFFTIIMQFLAPDPRPEKQERSPISNILRRKEFWIVTAAWVCCGIASMGIYNIVPLYLVKERGLQIEAANTIFGMSRFGGFIGMVFIGLIIDRFDLKKILMVILLATGITTIGIALADSYMVISAMLLAQATFSVVFFPAGLVAIARLTNLADRSMFTGVLMAISSIIGPGLSPMILGAVADLWNFQIGILIAGIIIILSLIPLKKLKGL